jgi:hypothetical protein
MTGLRASSPAAATRGAHYATCLTTVPAASSAAPSAGTTTARPANGSVKTARPQEAAASTHPTNTPPPPPGSRTRELGRPGRRHRHPQPKLARRGMHKSRPANLRRRPRRPQRGHRNLPHLPMLGRLRPRDRQHPTPVTAPTGRCDRGPPHRNRDRTPRPTTPTPTHMKETPHGQKMDQRGPPHPARRAAPRPSGALPATTEPDPADRRPRHQTPEGGRCRPEATHSHENPPRKDCSGAFRVTTWW